MQKQNKRIIINNVEAETGNAVMGRKWLSFQFFILTYHIIKKWKTTTNLIYIILKLLSFHSKNSKLTFQNTKKRKHQDYRNITDSIKYTVKLLHLYYIF